MPIDLSIIIPVYNRSELTLNCLESLAKNAADDLAHLDYEIVLVDNASTDNTPAILPEKGKDLFVSRFKFLRHEKNLNFAGGCNSGARAASGRRLFFLNNDTLLTPNWLAPLWKALDVEQGLANGLGAVGPLLLYPNETVQHLGIVFQVGGIVHLYAHFPANHPLVQKRRLGMQAITGAAILLDAELFKSTGEFFEGYANGFEDLELCLRIREQGKSLACIPESRIYHLESQTPGRSVHEDKNVVLFSERAGYGFKTDVHRWAIADGYNVRLSPYLDTIVEINQDKKDALQKYITALENITGKNPLRSELSVPAKQSAMQVAATTYEKAQEAVQILQSEPLWPEAYGPVCAFLEKEGRMQEALKLRFIQSRFYGSVENLQAWAKLATKNRLMDQVSYAGNMAKIYAKKQSERSKLIKLAIAQHSRAKNNQDAQLILMLENWLKIAGIDNY